MAQAMIDYQKELGNKQNQQMEREEKVDMEKLLKTFSTLESARPRFLSGRQRRSKKENSKIQQQKS